MVIFIFLLLKDTLSCSIINVYYFCNMGAMGETGPNFALKKNHVLNVNKVF